METDRQNHNFLSSLLLESEMLRFILFRKFYSGQLLIKILVAVLTNDKLGKDILFDPLNYGEKAVKETAQNQYFRIFAVSRNVSNRFLPPF